MGWHLTVEGARVNRLQHEKKRAATRRRSLPVRALRRFRPSAIAARVSPRIRLFLVLSLAALVSACTARRPKVDEAVPPDWIKNLPVQPLEITEYRVADAEGEHALFMRLSRFPDSSGYTVQEVPPAIILRLSGPSVGEDVPEERVVVSDAVITAVRVSRTSGALTIVVELTTPDVPPYLVDEAADWVTVRVRPHPHE